MFRQTNNHPFVAIGSTHANFLLVTSIINNDGDMLTVLDVLAKKVGIIGIFSDWPATVTYYANCMGL